jgi:hypothetical protein
LTNRDPVGYDVRSFMLFNLTIASEGGDNTLQIEKDLKQFMYQLRINAEVIVVELVRRKTHVDCVSIVLFSSNLFPSCV